MVRRFALPAALLVALGLAACGITARTIAPQNQIQVQDSATATIAPSPISLPSSMPTSSLRPTAEPAPPTEVPLITGQCPPEPDDVPIPPIDNVLDYGESLLQYLNAGGPIEQLAEHAAEEHLLGDVGVASGFTAHDLNGDGIPEIAISLVDQFEGRRPGRVYVAMCGDGRYDLAYTSADNVQYDTAKIETVFDITGDGLDDLIILLSSCGAHTCFDWLEVVVWEDYKFEDRMGTTYFDLPSTGIEFFGPITDGSYEIYMTGNGVASIGAGPYHRRAVTWRWDPFNRRFYAMDFRYLPSRWRIHFVHDGDQSFALGNYELALEYYNRVIHDGALQDWPSSEWNPAYEDSRPGELAAYARFRRILTRLKMGDPESAAVHYQDLIDNHPPGEYGEAFARMGEVFWTEFLASGDFNRACEVAQPFAPLSVSVDFPPLEYGYSNPTYTAAGMCPTTP
ncbi:MAG: tol-pal system YbgF family protein [Anaerolineales bacterium]